ncbi:RodZ family helix-turn-helix domain-containing protein [Thermocoleostomius sinensis]|uniref:Uncharacterized protein n=1 Tax=Thermocoleostomius sinensis A174 TaxID=2016057 RepID=A0A9E9C9S3_9CYAN|nr:hypothetical protein [Thermocoleostomius sinensis]WAL59987.1 hypothetical protein OXH18_22900 [Thermocoleostomius sinensis A174]
MVDSMDDIARQARQGSVSAIIQVLNDKLADSGIRTRAVFEQGVLQLLCEAPTPEQLEQSVLVPRVRQILESIQPHRIRRVNINSRIVREQQLLWLDEINRDPDNQLLWSEEITLRRPNLFQRLTQGTKERKPIDPKASLPKNSPVRVAREKRLFWRGLVGGASLSLFLLLIGWTVANWLERQSNSSQSASVSSPDLSSEPAATLDPTIATAEVEPSVPAESPASAASEPASTDSPTNSPVAVDDDPFTKAVNLAQTAVEAGQTADTSAEWLTLAAQWQQASDLMALIPPDDARYDIAQSRIEVYRQNSREALQQAQSRP